MPDEPDPKLAERAGESVAWLTTVTPKNRPAPRPVWFVLAGNDIIVFSSGEAAKVRHIRANPDVSFHFNTNPGGGDVLVVSGTAELLDPSAKASTTPGYLDKYADQIPAIGLDVAGFDATYDTGIRIRPARSWSF